jgi:hypothetical protein
MADEEPGPSDRFANFGSGLIRRHQEGRPIFGLPVSFTGQRWLSRDGSDDFGLAHGKSRPDPEPLITIGLLGGAKLEDRGGHIDVHDTLGTFLLLAERSRNDPAFQHGTRDQDAIERAMALVPGPEAWQPTLIEVDGVPAEFLRCGRDSDWIAFRDLGGECLWIHAQQPDGTPISIVTINDITPYLHNHT